MKTISLLVDDQCVPFPSSAQISLGFHRSSRFYPASYALPDVEPNTSFGHAGTVDCRPVDSKFSGSTVPV